MTYIIIAIIILLVGAAAEIIAYVFTDKMLKKREDGLDRRRAALYAYEECTKPVGVSASDTQSRKLVKICGETHIDRRDFDCLAHMPQDYIQTFINGTKLQIWEQLILRIPARETINPDGSITIRAELWVAEGGPDDGVS